MIYSIVVERSKAMNKIIIYRAKMGYTQDKLAELCGVSRNTINSYEKGRVKKNIKVLLKMAEQLNVSVFELADMDIFLIKPQTKEEVAYLIDMLNAEYKKLCQLKEI
jgi:putative transcriptional regulator